MKEIQILQKKQNWLNATQDEIKSLKDNNTLTLTDS